MPHKPQPRQPRRPRRPPAVDLVRWVRRAVCLAGASVLLLAAGRPASASAPRVPDYGRTPTSTTTAGPGATASSPQLPDPIEVEPAWRDLPGKDKILSLLDVISQLGLACCIAAVVIGGGIMGISKITGAGRGGTVAYAMVLGGGGGTILIVVAPDVVAWLAT